MGGSSLAKPEHIQLVADRVSRLHKEGHPVIVVVSAMGKTTDQLVELAYSVSTSPNRRELDMLLTTGERVSMALMSMALNDRNCRAISFTGSQAGVLTDDRHSNARIADVKPIRVEAELRRGNVVVLAGFQGVSPLTKEITTLGRGGSDTTAVAMAAVFKAERCEIRKDVDGVHSADPNTVQGTEHIPHLHYRSLLDMTFWGAKVLHYRSVELAALLTIQMVITLAHEDGRSTLINGDAIMYEEARILSVNTHKEVRRLKVKCLDLSSAFQEIKQAMKTDDLPLPQFLDSEIQGDFSTFLVTAPIENMVAIERSIAKSSTLVFEPQSYSSVTATCQGSYASSLPGDIANALKHSAIPIHKLIFGAMSLTVIVTSTDRERAVQTIHDLRPNTSPT